MIHTFGWYGYNFGARKVHTLIYSDFAMKFFFKTIFWYFVLLHCVSLDCFRIYNMYIVVIVSGCGYIEIDRISFYIFYATNILHVRKFHNIVVAI